MISSNISGAVCMRSSAFIIVQNIATPQHLKQIHGPTAPSHPTSTITLGMLYFFVVCPGPTFDYCLAARALQQDDCIVVFHRCKLGDCSRIHKVQIHNIHQTQYQSVLHSIYNLCLGNERRLHQTRSFGLERKSYVHSKEKKGLQPMLY